MTKHPLVAGVALALLASATAVVAQDYVFINFRWGYQDHVLPGNPPCFSSHPVQPWTFDGSAWFVWTCDDGRVMPRRFFDKAPQPTAYLPPTPTPTLTPLPAPTGCPTQKPGPGWVCAADGGWRPPGM
jgi:hypothetical protein